MRRRLTKLLAMAGILAGFLSAMAWAQQGAPDGNAQPLPAAALDQMLAPIALYPDALLSQILMASTYPLEIVQADRWLRSPGNAMLRGDALADALTPLPWDPSVKSLVPFPKIVQLMDENLDWTERVGNAFLADEAAVMDSIQRLRSRARAAGKLVSTDESTVFDDDGAIAIAPVNPGFVYLPVYDPYVAYGPWPYPAYPPFVFPGIWGGVVIGDLGFGWVGFDVVLPLWGWSFCNWHNRRIDVERARFGNRNGTDSRSVWQHDPAHRFGVPYGGATSSRHPITSGASPELQRSFRGYAAPSASPLGPASRPPSGAPARPAYQAPPGVPRQAPMTRPPAVGARSPSVPPTFESFGHGADVRSQAQRGQTSRMSGAMPQPSGATGRSFSPSAGSSGGHGRR